MDYIYDYRFKGYYSTSDELAQYEKMAARYLRDTRRNRALDLLHFVQHEGNKGVVPCTARIHLMGIQQWFLENDIVLSEKDKMRLRRVSPRGGRRTNFKYLDVEILREILLLAELRMRALILIAACTGMRIGEILALKWSYITIPDRTKPENSEKLTEIFIPDSKNQTHRRVWITREAEDVLLAWKNQTSAYLENSVRCSRNLGVTCDTLSGRVFPFSPRPVYAAWNDALSRLGRYTVDDVTHRVQLNVHRLRGFFKMQTLPIVGSEMSELMLGHCDAYGHAYNGLPDDQLEKLFQKCESALTVAPAYAAARDIAIQTAELQNVRGEMLNLRDIVVKLASGGSTAATFEGNELVLDKISGDGRRSVNRVRVR
jgi:Site-specific recombinase XerD